MPSTWAGPQTISTFRRLSASVADASAVSAGNLARYAGTSAWPLRSPAGGGDELEARRIAASTKCLSLSEILFKAVANQPSGGDREVSAAAPAASPESAAASIAAEAAVVVVVVVVLLIIPRCHDGWGERDPYPMS
mmetsp:Transcript_67267/g.140519  ORF Transcript_67267/g.140519 Transcript_67267/m.140519 type:complete len:136 (+) Transcript_67267:206-613(+)